MEKYKLRKGFDKSLVSKCSPVKDISKIQKYIPTMKDCMLNNAKGISAPQIGVLKQFFIMKINKQYEMFINPEIIEKKHNFLSIEMCLSFKNTIGIKIRKYNVKVEYFDNKNNFKEKWFKGENAVAIQHEMDHLKGKTINPFVNLYGYLIKKKE